MQQLEQRIKEMKAKLDEAKNLRYKAEIRLEDLERQEKEILAELEALGVEPDQLDEEIARLEREIEQGIEEAWSLLPRELIRDDASN
jgi:chromosome segregation ATPase